MKGLVIINNKNCIFYQIDENLNKTIIKEFRKKVKVYQAGENQIKFSRLELEYIYIYIYIRKYAEISRELFDISNIIIEGDLSNKLKEILQIY